MHLHLRPLAVPLGTAEIVERKGLGHPDTLCDVLVEALSARLSRAYLERCGRVLHHNLDKALLFGGASAPAFGGGEVLAPIELYLAGRATVQVGGAPIEVEELAHEVVHDWLGRNLRNLDPEQHLRLRVLVRGGSAHLRDLFAAPERPRCNDTSIGVGYAPLSPLEQAVLAVEAELCAAETRERSPALGEDVKVMGTRLDAQVELTVAVAMVDRHLPDAAAYEAQREWIRRRVEEVARPLLGDVDLRVGVNTGDDPRSGRLYLTVTGTSAEGGDDGQVGRGNRVNGLITPFRPMSLEAAAGKNPVTHVGKLYNLLAGAYCRDLVQQVPAVLAARLALVSRIGDPVDEPAFADLQVALPDGEDPAAIAGPAEALLHRHLSQMDALRSALIAGQLAVC